jgi:hypothetical protein
VFDDALVNVLLLYCPSLFVTLSLMSGVHNHYFNNLHFFFHKRAFAFTTIKTYTLSLLIFVVAVEDGGAADEEL